MANESTSNNSEIKVNGEQTIELSPNYNKILPAINTHLIKNTLLSYSDPIPLNSEFLTLDSPNLQLLELQPNLDCKGVSAIFMFSKQTPIGYIVFELPNDQHQRPILGLNGLQRGDMKKLFDKIPQHLADAAIDTQHYAFMIDPPARGQNLGKLLFLAGVAHLKDLGYDKLDVVGDLTQSYMSGHEDSFYHRYIDQTSTVSARLPTINTNIISQYLDYLKDIFQNTPNKSSVNHGRTKLSLLQKLAKLI